MDEREAVPGAPDLDLHALVELFVDLARTAPAALPGLDEPGGHRVRAGVGGVAAERVLPDEPGGQDQVDVGAGPPGGQAGAFEAQFHDALGGRGAGGDQDLAGDGAAPAVPGDGLVQGGHRPQRGGGHAAADGAADEQGGPGGEGDGGEPGHQRSPLAPGEEAR